LFRLGVAYILAHAKLSNSKQRPSTNDVLTVLERVYEGDDVAPLLLKAATVPATTTTSSWADVLANGSVADFFGAVGASYAGAGVLSRGIQLTFNAASVIIVPGMLTSASNTSFVLQGAPIPVRALTVSTPALLAPHKLATICLLHREAAEYSLPSLEALVRAGLVESVGLAIDAALFGVAAGSDTTIAGLRNGISAGTESANADLYEAMLEDIQTVASSVAAVANGGPIALVMAPARAI
jgi:hypothetical protein